MTKYEVLNYALERERGRRHEEYKALNNRIFDVMHDKREEINVINRKLWDVNSMISIHRQEMDQILNRLYMLEETIKSITRK